MSVMVRPVLDDRNIIYLHDHNDEFIGELDCDRCTIRTPTCFYAFSIHTRDQMIEYIMEGQPIMAIRLVHPSYVAVNQQSE